MSMLDELRLRLLDGVEGPGALDEAGLEALKTKFTLCVLFISDLQLFIFLINYVEEFKL